MKLKLVVLALAVTLALPGSATAAGPPIENISPSDGSALTVPAGGAVNVEFTCPRFATSYSGTHDWTSYWVEFATNPTLNSEGEFATPYLVGLERAYPTNVTEDRCTASLEGWQVESGGTFYWRTTRTNCDATSCSEGGPTWRFTTAPPAPVAPSSPTPTVTVPGPATPATPSPPAREGRVTVYLGCGTNAKTKASASCRKNEAIGAFFKDSADAVYTVCVKFPGGDKACSHEQHAEAGVLYVNTVKRHSVGSYTVTWNVGGRRFVRHVRRALK